MDLLRALFEAQCRAGLLDSEAEDLESRGNPTRAAVLRHDAARHRYVASQIAERLREADHLKSA